jgi:hypothetical protein
MHGIFDRSILLDRFFSSWQEHLNLKCLQFLSLMYLRPNFDDFAIVSVSILLATFWIKQKHFMLWLRVNRMIGFQIRIFMLFRQ